MSKDFVLNVPETIIHPTGPVASAILAYAEFKRGVSGEQLLTALVAGIEAECKVGLAVWPSHYDVGWHITSSTGSIGAAVAVGKLMNLNPEKMAHAIGLASAQVVGLREMFGSDCKSFHPGRAAQAGLLASLLAEKGYTSSTKALEAKRGWANVVVCGGKPQLDKYIGELGSVWETAKNSFKPFPCGIVKHPAIDAAIQIHHELKAKGALASIKDLHFECQVHPLVIELTSKPTPQDGLQAKFSVFHGVAVGLLYGKAGPGQYADDVVRDSTVIAVRDSVKATSSDKIRSDEAVVTALDQSGDKVAEIHVDRAVGSLEKPLDVTMLNEKFIDQVALDLGEQKAKLMSDAAWDFEGESDVASVIAKLRN